MERTANRRGFLGRAVALIGGLAAIPALEQPAQAGRSTRRRFGWGGGYGWGGYGYGGYGFGGRRGSHFRRGWGYGRPYYGGYGGFGGYGRPYYGGYGAPYVRPFGGGFYGPAPRVFGGPGFYPPMLKRQGSPFPDPLGLLEA